MIIICVYSEKLVQNIDDWNNASKILVQIGYFGN